MSENPPTVSSSVPYEERGRSAKATAAVLVAVALAGAAGCGQSTNAPNQGYSCKVTEAVVTNPPLAVVASTKSTTPDDGTEPAYFGIISSYGAESGVPIRSGGISANLGILTLVLATQAGSGSETLTLQEDFWRPDNSLTPPVNCSRQLIVSFARDGTIANVSLSPAHTSSP